MESNAWQAVWFEGVMPAGRTRPLLLGCVRGNPARRERRRFVIKAIGLPEVESFSLAHEFLGCRLARAYGLAAPRAEVVELSAEFLTAAEAETCRRKTCVSTQVLQWEPSSFRTSCLFRCQRS